MIHFHMQRFKFIDCMVIELGFFKKMKNKKKVKIRYMYILHVHHNKTNFCTCRVLAMD